MELKNTKKWINRQESVFQTNDILERDACTDISVKLYLTSVETDGYHTSSTMKLFITSDDTCKHAEQQFNVTKYHYRENI